MRQVPLLFAKSSSPDHWSTKALQEEIQKWVRKSEKETLREPIIPPAHTDCRTSHTHTPPPSIPREDGVLGKRGKEHKCGGNRAGSGREQGIKKEGTARARKRESEARKGEQWDRGQQRRL